VYCPVQVTGAVEQDSPVGFVAGWSERQLEAGFRPSFVPGAVEQDSPVGFVAGWSERQLEAGFRPSFVTFSLRMFVLFIDCLGFLCCYLVVVSFFC